MWGLERNEFKKSDEFRFFKEDKKNDKSLYFVSDLGKRVLTDKVGKEIWNALPASGERICEKVREKYWVSLRLVYEFLSVLSYARIIRSDPPLSHQPNPEKKEASPQTTNKDLVSVILVTHNGQDYIKACLNSIFRQTYEKIEVICVDNHSADKTVSLIEENFPQVRIKALKKNHHYARGINKGLKQAQGSYFFILNQDTELDKDCVRNLVKKAASVPKAGAVVPMMKFAKLRTFINGIGNQVSDRSWGTDNYIYCVDFNQFQDLKEVPSACFGAVLLRREAVEKVGKADPGYGSFYEDVDWSFRCWYQGWKVVPEPEAVVFHEFGGSYKQGKKLFFAVRNRLRLVLKLFQRRVMLGFLRKYIKEDIRSGLSFLKKGQLWKIVLYMTAYISLALYLPEIMVKRWKALGKKIKGMRERKVLIKNPSFYCCLNPERMMPEINTAVIRRYYRWHLMKQHKGDI